MFSEYKAQVVRRYHQKKSEGSISLNLQDPSPGNLKRECLDAFEERRTRKDLDILKQWFGPKEDEAAYERAIRNTEADKFKSLTQFLRGQRKDTSVRNIALLSWLIDFSPRPYKPGWELSNDNGPLEAPGSHESVSGSDNMTNVTDDAKQVVVEDDIGDVPADPAGPTILRRALNYLARHKKIIVFILIIVGTERLLSIKDIKGSMIGWFKQPKCAYWSGVYYVEVDCDSDRANIERLDSGSFRLEHFRKITRPDTLTEHDINRVWYGKNLKQIEFYTGPGKDPRNTNKYLRPMTKYIYDKYIRPLKN